ncbi:hypothetical protein ABFS83_11G128500 [Erythranthe nasuta]
MSATGRAGYEYNYEFSVDDEIVLRYNYTVVPGKKTFLFEIRTIFILKKTDGVDEIMGSERCFAEISVNDEQEAQLLFGFNWLASYRLKEYWMTEEDIARFDQDTIDFTKKIEADPGRAHRRTVPIGIDLKVCTVQQEGEEVGPALERVIRAEKLIPLYVYPLQMGLENGPPPPIPLGDMFRVFLWELERTRVEDLNQGLAMMQDCGVCLRAPIVGDQISVLPSCGHALHSHCIVRSLLEKRECPLCHSLVTFDPMAAYANVDPADYEMSKTLA